MSWLSRLGRRRPPAALGAPDTPPPVEASGAPITAWLDDIGLPWSDSRAALTARFGVERDPAYEWNIVPIATDRPAAPGLISPLHVQADHFAAPDLPATSFSAVSWLENDARRNIAAVAQALAEFLGPAPVGREANVLTCAWREGAASVRLTAWPPDLQSHLSVPAWERDPRLATACHLHIQTGWRRPLSDADRVAIDGFVPLVDLPLNPALTSERIATDPPAESELDIARDPGGLEQTLFGQLGRSADAGLLIVCTAQLYLIPTTDVLRLEVDRLLPAKGGGGSTLLLVRRAWDGEEIRLTLCHGRRPDDLNGLAEQIASVLAKPLVIGEPDYDV